MADSITPHPAGTTFFTVVRAFLKDHENLVLAAVAALVIWYGIGKVEDVIARHDAANLQQAQAALTAQVAANDKTAALVAQQKKDFDALAAKYEAQNAALAQANVALATALTKQQRTDAVMTDPELAARWNMLVPESAVVITNGQATLPDAGAHATVGELEKVPVLTTELANERTTVQNVNALLLGSQQQVVTLTTLVDGKNLELKKADGVCTDKIKVEAAKARKSKRRWLIIGYVAGFLSRQYIKTTTGF